MGTSIHFYVDRRQDDGTWVSADTWFEEDGQLSCYGLDDEGKFKNFTFYSKRSYPLFAILADVRNEDNFVPIVAPRGIPDSATPEYRRVVEFQGTNIHSHTYFTLAEFLAFDWNQTIHCSGFVSVEEWVTHHKNPDGPRFWVTDLRYVNSDIYLVSDEQVQELLLKGESHRIEKALNEANNRPKGYPYVEKEWYVSYEHCVPTSLWTETLPRLMELGDPEDTRIVIHFDN